MTVWTLATMAGLCLVLAQAPFSFLPAAIAAPLLLARAARAPAKPARRYLAAAAGSAVAFSVGCHWLAHTAVANLALMVASQAVAFPAVVALLRVGPGGGVWPAPWLAVAWTAVEFARSHGPFNGFPWLLLGYGAARPLELAQFADVAGVFGWSFVLAFLAGLLDRAFDPRPMGSRARAVAAVACVLAAIWGYGLLRMRAVADRTVRGPVLAMVQGNVPQRLKNSLDGGEMLRAYDEASREVLRASSRDGGVDLLVWPETMVPAWFPREAGSDSAWKGEEDAFVRGYAVPRLLEPLGAFGLFGVILRSSAATDDLQEPASSNAAVLYAPTGERLAQYEKSVLVPGGEFVPLVDLLPRFVLEWIRDLAGVIPHLRPGAGPRLMRLERGGREFCFAPTICYENTYPGYNLRAVRLGADFLLNLSNEAWFLDSVEMDQMEVASRFRAIESRRSLARCTNSGITAIYDARGKRVAVLVRDGRDREVRGALVAEVPIYRGASVYRATGDVLPVASMIAAAIASMVRLWRRYRRGRRP